MKRKYLIVNIVLVLLCLALLGIVIFRQSIIQNREPGSSGEDLADHLLEITNLDVGKADAAVIRFQDSVGIIDTGTEASFPRTDSWLQAHGISAIDYLILTHYDQDHIGGAVALLNAYDVKTVYFPDYVSEKEYYEGLMEVLKSREGTVCVSEEETFQIGPLRVDVIPADDPKPLLADEDNADNDMSLLCMITYGERRFLFTGDIERDRIQQLLDGSHDLAADWIKLPHHGDYESNDEEFLEMVAPAYAVISTSSDEAPAKKLIKLLKRMEIETFTTINGEVTTTSDGADLTVKEGQ